MSKKHFLLAEKISIWIIFFLFFSENTFSFSIKNNEKEFSENFYSDIYEKTDYKKKSLERISNETWLDEDFLIWFENPNNIKLKKWEKKKSLFEKCKEEGSKNWNLCKIINKNNTKDSIYYNNYLINKINFEIKLVKLEQKLKSIWDNEDIFSDWDYKNSFFNVVTQWNIIDAILFWKDWMTPFFKYKKSEDNQGNIKKIDNQNPENTYTQTENKTNKEVITYFWYNTSFKSEILNNSIKNWSSDSKIFKDKNWKIITDICIDPFLVENNLNNQKIFYKNNKNYSNIEKILKNNNNSWKNISQDNQSNYSYDDTNYTITSNWFIEPKEDEWEKCKKPLYWWYICLDSNKWDCFPIWKKINWSNEGENWKFCWEIKYISWSQDLFWNREDTNCINCYIKKSLQIIEDKIEWQVVYPRPNDIKMSIPNSKWINRDYSFLEISYKPMPWDKENYKKNEKKEETTLEKKCEAQFRDIIQQSLWNIDKLFKLSKEGKITQDKYCKNNKLKLDSKESIAIIKDAYFWDTNQRITEFRNLFQKWILKNIESMPFDKLENIPSCKSLTN